MKENTSDRFINVGSGNIVNAERVVTVVTADSAPAKRVVQDARNMGRAVDCTGGRRTRAVLITDSDHVILSALRPNTLLGRLNGWGTAETEDEEETDGES